MTLFLTPVLYSLFNEKREKKNMKKEREVEKWRREEGAMEVDDDTN